MRRGMDHEIQVGVSWRIPTLPVQADLDHPMNRSWANRPMSQSDGDADLSAAR